MNSETERQDLKRCLDESRLRVEQAIASFNNNDLDKILTRVASIKELMAYIEYVIPIIKENDYLESQVKSDA